MYHTCIRGPPSLSSGQYIMQIDAVEVYGKDTQSYTSLEHVNIHKKLDESLPNASLGSSLVDKPPKHQKKQWKSMK